MNDPYMYELAKQIICFCIAFILYLCTHTVFHELGHVWFANMIRPMSATIYLRCCLFEKRSGRVRIIRKKKMERFALGYTEFDDSSISRREEKIIAFGGPAVELIYAEVILVAISCLAAHYRTMLWGVPLMLLLVFTKSITSEGEDTDRSRFHRET